MLFKTTKNKERHIPIIFSVGFEKIELKEKEQMIPEEDWSLMRRVINIAQNK